MSLLSIPGVWIWQLVVLSRDIDEHHERAASEIAAAVALLAEGK